MTTLTLWGLFSHFSMQLRVVVFFIYVFLVTHNFQEKRLVISFELSAGQMI